MNIFDIEIFEYEYIQIFSNIEWIFLFLFRYSKIFDFIYYKITNYTGFGF
jgi:hypothetical protein